MIKSIFYFFHKKHLTHQLKQGHFLLYSEMKKIKNTSLYKEDVYLLVRDRVFKINLEYGDYASSHQHNHYQIIQHLTIKNHTLFAKIFKYGKPTHRHFNLIHHVMEQEKKLKRHCSFVPIIPADIVHEDIGYSDSHV